MPRRLLSSLVLFASLLTAAGLAHAAPAPKPAAAAPAAAAQTEANRHVYTLKNGMKVILQPVRSVPVTAIQVWVHVGSKDETDATRGLAHIQEHMLFKGTATYGPGRIFQEIEGVGGDLNAFTSNDMTVYHAVMPASTIQRGVDMFASMMHEATLDPAELSRELEVVMEEFRRAKDNAATVMRERLYSEAITTHPYRFPVIGYRDTIEKIQAAQVRDFYRRWYVPQNMTLVLVGDFEVPAAKVMIARSFGKIPVRANPKRAIPPEPAQTAHRSFTMTGPFENTRLAIAFRNPALQSPDGAVADVLFTLLGGGESSRLTRVLREEKKLVTGISVASDTPEQESLGVIYADVKPENAAAAVSAILGEMYRLKTEPVTEEELDRAKTQMVSQFVYNRQDFAGIADVMGYFAVVGGDVTLLDHYIRRIQAVTPADIRRFAQERFVDTHLTAGILYPEKQTGMLAASDLDRLLTQSALTGSAGDARPKNLASIKFDRKNNVTKVTLKNGATLLLREDHSVPSIAFQATFLGGLRTETAKTNGVTGLLSQMLLRGTAARTQEEIARDLEKTGSSIDGFADRNTFGISGRALREHGSKTLAIAADLLTSSAFPEGQLAQEKALTIDALRRRRDNPRAVAIDRFAALLYGDHPYGLPAGGTEESVSTLTREDLRAYADQYLVPRNMVFAVVGDFETRSLAAELAASLGAWQGGDVAMPALPPVAFPPRGGTVYAASPKQQSNIYLGVPTFPIGHPDRFALEVLNNILSGASGRLFQNLRDKQSLAYSVGGTFASALDQPGYYVFYIGSQPEKTQQAIDGLRSEVRNLVGKGFSDRELRDAVEYSAGNFVIALQSFGSQANALSRYERYGLGYKDLSDYVRSIRAVTRADVERVGKTYLDLDRAVLSVVGPVEGK